VGATFIGPQVSELLHSASVAIVVADISNSVTADVDLQKRKS